MSAFKDYYLKEVEKYLSRNAADEEVEKAKQLYIEGWHPRRTADLFILKCEKKDCWKQRVCFHYCSEHHRKVCMIE